jgi:hypothetical protein
MKDNVPSFPRHQRSGEALPFRDRDPGASIFISRLGVVETVSVFAKKVRSGLISATDFGLLRRRFFADLRQRRPSIVRLLVRHFQEADRLLQQHSLTINLNTLDSLQLAVALDLRRRGMLDELVASDRVVLAVATLEGLKTFNPESP